MVCRAARANQRDTLAGSHVIETPSTTAGGIRWVTLSALSAIVAAVPSMTPSFAELHRRQAFQAITEVEAAAQCAKVHRGAEPANAEEAHRTGRSA